MKYLDKETQDRIRQFFRDHWLQLAAGVGLLPVVTRMFLSRMFYPLTVMLAAVPLEQHVLTPLGQKAGCGQVSMKILSFALMGALTLLSWHVGELIIILTTVALVMEGSHLAYCILMRWQSMEEEENLACATV